MFEGESVTRLFRITREIGCVATGLIADSRSLVARARHEASNYAYKHAHPIPIDMLARRVANLAQVSTQEAGMRPMACMLTFIGIDEERGGPQVSFKNREVYALKQILICSDSTGSTGSFAHSNRSTHSASCASFKTQH